MLLRAIWDDTGPQMFQSFPESCRARLVRDADRQICVRTQLLFSAQATDDKTVRNTIVHFLRISSCNFEPIKAILKGVSYHFSNTATGPVLLVPFSPHALESFRTNWRPYFLRRVAVILSMNADCSHATKTRTLASSNLLICSDVISN